MLLVIQAPSHRISDGGGGVKMGLRADTATAVAKGVAMAHLSPSLPTSPFPMGLLMAGPAGQGLLPVTDSLCESGRPERGCGMGLPF